MEILHLLNHLRDRGWLATNDAAAEALTGGVSSEIWLVTDGARRFVVKRALPKLRVQQEWRADPARNLIEQECLRYLGQIVPQNVPKILFQDPEMGLFGMEFFDAHFANWKSELLRGEIQERDAIRAAQLMAKVHGASWDEPEAKTRFSTWPNFFSLRIEPYLLAAGSRHPALQPLFAEESERLRNATLALTHGDFSPKNILVSSDRLVLLDCEAAWFGDPAFDAAFLLNHLLLKALFRPRQRDALLHLASLFHREYRTGLGTRFDADFDSRVARLLLLLLLARVDGKSPVEYLTDPAGKDHVRDFVTRALPNGPFALAELIELWRKSIRVP